MFTIVTQKYAHQFLSILNLSDTKIFLNKLTHFTANFYYLYYLTTLAKSQCFEIKNEATESSVAFVILGCADGYRRVGRCQGISLCFTA